MLCHVCEHRRVQTPGPPEIGSSLHLLVLLLPHFELLLPFSRGPTPTDTQGSDQSSAVNWISIPWTILEFPAIDK